MENESRIGERVMVRDPHTGRDVKGEIIAYRRSTKNPWKVFVVRQDTGEEIEIHPDRIG